LFLGGWRAPFGIGQIDDGYFNTGYWPLLWFFGKTLGFIFVFVWLRGTLPRMRYDQFMSFGWKILIPVSLAWIIAVALIRKLKSEDMLDQQVLSYVAIAAGILVVLTFFIPEKKPEPEPEPEEFDAFAGGYPVPPMPGQRTTTDVHPVDTDPERTAPR
jgi:NADH-quinone oxidoreductase subunit H